MSAKTKNQSGIVVKIEAFIPTGSTIDEAYQALSVVRDAQESGDYSNVLAHAKIDNVTVKQISRRVPVEAAPADGAQEMPLSGRKSKAA